jgi:predicted secreted protein
MAAPTQPIPGIKLLTLISSTIVGAQSDAVLNLSQELREIVTKNNFGWVNNLSGRQEWSVDHSGLLLDDSGNDFIANSNATLALEFDNGSGDGNQPEYHEIQRLDSIDMTLDAAVAQTGGLDQQLWRYIRPAERSMTIDIEGSYLDPAASPDDVGEEYKEIFARKDSGTVIPARFTIAGHTFESDVAIGDVEISASAQAEDVTISVSMASDGQVTQGGTSFDSSVSMIIDAFFNETLANVALEYQDGGSAVSGSTTFTGSGFFTSVSISAADGEEATLDATIDGDGPLTQSTIP